MYSTDVGETFELGAKEIPSIVRLGRIDRVGLYSIDHRRYFLKIHLSLLPVEYLHSQ